MNDFPFYLVFCHSMPEIALVTTLGMVLIGFRPEYKKILMVTLLGALISYCIRLLPLPPGLHGVFLVPVVIALVVACCRMDLFAATLAVFSGVIVLSIAEGIFNILTPKISGFTFQDVAANPLLRVLFPLPEYIFLTVVTFIAGRFRWRIVNLREIRDLEVQVKGREKE